MDCAWYNRLYLFARDRAYYTALFLVRATLCCIIQPGRHSIRDIHNTYERKLLLPLKRTISNVKFVTYISHLCLKCARYCLSYSMEELCHHWIRQCLFTWLVPRHYLSQCWFTINPFNSLFRLTSKKHQTCITDMNGRRVSYRLCFKILAITGMFL